MADTPKHSVSVAGVVVDDHGRVLVIKRRDNGHWEPPGGVLELEESPEQGVVREVREETGIYVEVKQLSGVYKNMARGVIALVFRCQATGGQVQESSESSLVQWRPSSEIKDLMSEAYAIRVLDALDVEARPVHVRTHDGVALVEVSSPSA